MTTGSIPLNWEPVDFTKAREVNLGSGGIRREGPRGVLDDGLGHFSMVGASAGELLAPEFEVAGSRLRRSTEPFEELRMRLAIEQGKRGDRCVIAH